MSLPEHDLEADRARARLDGATADVDPPLAVLDVDALDANAADLARRASGTPIRVASKSVRNRAVLRRVLDRPGFAGVLAYSLPEALWLSTGDDPVSTDVVVGYPSADRSALRRLAADEAAAARVTLMVDSAAQLDLVDAVVPPGRRPALRICLDVDASLRAAGGRVHVGVRRSPVHSVADAVALARLVTGRPGFALVGVMAYEAQIAGVQDAPARRPLRGVAVRGMQKVSARELAGRRAEVVAAVSAVAPLEFVNGGGTGSVERTAAEDAVTEVAAGSGLYCPVLFDGYRAFAARPAAFFAAPVTRIPGARHRDRGRRRLDRLRAAREGPAAGADVPGRPLVAADRGDRRGADPAARPRDGVAARRRPGVVPAREGRRGLRARQRAAHAGRRRADRRLAHLPRRGQGLRLTRRRAPGGRWGRW